MSSELRAFLEGMPKVEIHLHLEGAIPLEALWELVCKYGGQTQVPTPEALAERFRYRDFPHFIETWVWKNGFIREYEDFTFIASAVARDLARQNVRYAEAFYSPGDFARRGLELGRITEALRRGLETQRADVRVALVTDLIRDFGPERGMRSLEEVAEVRSLGVVGIGIGGSEHAFPPEPWAPVYARARELGFRTSAHAGEAAGPESVRGALGALRVDRIGHGTRAVEDPELVARLAAERIPLEMCPISNLRTGVVPELRLHPLVRFLRAGLLVSVNTDDPKMFHTSLAGEYEALVESCGLGLADVATLAANAIDSAWCAPAEKRALRDELSAYLATAT